MGARTAWEQEGKTARERVGLGMPRSRVHSREQELLGGAPNSEERLQTTGRAPLPGHTRACHAASSGLLDPEPLQSTNGTSQVSFGSQ